jgi:hypothetical protein
LFQHSQQHVEAGQGDGQQEERLDPVLQQEEDQAWMMAAELFEVSQGEGEWDMPSLLA